MAKVLRRILLTEITKDDKKLETILCLSNRDFTEISCKQVAEISDELFNFVPKNNNPGFKKFVEYINSKQSDVYNDAR